jgi:ATP-dependent exoDNAse (exonuclease V) alpha subunit
LRNLLGEQAVLVLAPTGVAAFNIRGRTIHNALHIPIGKFEEMGTGSKVLEAMQQDLSSVRLVIIDEFSMVSRAMLAKIDRRLRQAFPACAQQAFGGRSVLLTGDLCQLNPANGVALFAGGNSRCQLSQAGGVLYKLFHTVFFLDKQVRQASDPEFASLLQRIREGKVEVSDWNTLMKRRVVSTSFLNESCVQLFPTNEEVDASNEEKLHSLKSPTNPICRIKPIIRQQQQQSHRTTTQKTAPDLKILIGARVMLQRNLSIRHGLVNGSIGVVQGIAYSRGARPPQMPDCVFVEFDNYHGPSLRAVDDDGPACRLVPIVAMPSADGRRGSQLPLRLAWAITVHKSQGLTLREAFVGLSTRGKCVSGLLYVALSRVKRLQDLHVGQCSLQRLKQLTQSSGVKEAELKRLRLLSAHVD